MPTNPNDNKVLVRHGTNLLDIEWEDVKRIISSDKIFSDKHEWVSTIPNTQYTGLQRLGVEIPNVDYLPLQTKSQQDDLASIFDEAGDIHCFVCNGTDSLNMECIPSGFVDNTLDVVDNGVVRGKDTDKGLKIIFVFTQATKDTKIAEIKLKLTTSVTMEFENAPSLKIPIMDADISSTDTTVVISEPSLFTKYDEYNTTPPTPVRIVFDKQ